MAKVFIRTLRNEYRRTLWVNESDRERRRVQLNEDGFYVLTGTGDSLDVYVIQVEDTMDIIDGVLQIIVPIVGSVVCLWVAYQIFLLLVRR